jgi:NAD(P)-dependent dehydrogenase (short-subunit alcohol dehydrogenase family)
MAISRRARSAALGTGLLENIDWVIVGGESGPIHTCWSTLRESVNVPAVGTHWGLAPDGIESICAHFETNVIGILRMIRCFAPILAPNRGGAFLNVLSVASWVNSGAVTAYAVSKAAAWSMTNGLRNELRQQNT